MGTDTAGLRVLTRAECLGRLRSVSLGRVGLSSRALPLILPVHFGIDDDDRIRLTARLGSTLAGATDGVVVAFEAEGPAGAVDPTWSVVVHGTAVHVMESLRVLRRDHVEVAISLDEVSGREVLDPAGPMAPLVPSVLPRW